MKCKVKSSHPHEGKMVSPGKIIDVPEGEVAGRVQQGRIFDPKDKTKTEKPAKDAGA